MHAVKTIIIALLIFAVAIAGTLFILKRGEHKSLTTPAATTLGATSATTPGPDAVTPASAALPAVPTVVADAHERNRAGTINLVDGVSHVVAPDHSSRVPKAGEAIYEGDAIQTDDGAELHIDMADGGFIAVRPNSVVNLTSYQANGEPADHSVIGLVKGSLRSITGWIGHTSPNNYSIVTPSATIGIRGTDHEPAYVAEGIPGLAAGTYDNVHAGGTTITTPAGHVDVSPAHAGFASPRREAPRILPSVPSFFGAPRKHDGVFIGKHDQIIASLAQKRTERQAAYQREQASPTRRQNGATPFTPRAALPSHSPAARLDPAMRASVPLHHGTEPTHLASPAERGAEHPTHEAEPVARAGLRSAAQPANEQRQPLTQQRLGLTRAPLAPTSRPAAPLAARPAAAAPAPIARPPAPLPARPPIVPPRKKPLFPN